FVAGFIGTANLFRGTVTATEGGLVRLELPCGGIATVAAGGHAVKAGDRLAFSVRSENLEITTAARDGFVLPATVAENSYVGGMLRIVFRLPDGKELYSTRHGVHRKVLLGDTVSLCWEPDNAVLVDMGGDTP
ncbi:MAG: TOBE domain-containing protein, partial [Angelakisella sp.]